MEGRKLRSSGRCCWKKGNQNFLLHTHLLPGSHWPNPVGSQRPRSPGLSAWRGQPPVLQSGEGQNEGGCLWDHPGVFSPAHYRVGVDCWISYETLTCVCCSIPRGGRLFMLLIYRGIFWATRSYLELPGDNLSSPLLSSLKRLCKMFQTGRGEKEMQLFS